MATTLEIVNGISQVLANTYDGALDEKGEPIEIGLKREEGHPIHDSRVMDGFKVSFQADSICIHYHAEIKLKDIYSGTFEQDIEAMIDQIAKFIKKEYKKVTGNALQLTAQDEAKIIAQNTSRVRTFVQAHRFYKFNATKEDDPTGPGHIVTDSVDSKFKTFLDQGGWKNDAKPQGQPVYTGKGKVQTRKDIHSPFKAE
tara:strand:- start:1238 stop:1834 length:597 start_codon:yes stop_codon:yes gene_type:complete